MRTPAFSVAGTRSRVFHRVGCGRRQEKYIVSLQSDEQENCDLLLHEKRREALLQAGEANCRNVLLQGSRHSQVTQVTARPDWESV